MKKFAEIYILVIFSIMFSGGFWLFSQLLVVIGASLGLSEMTPGEIDKALFDGLVGFGVLFVASAASLALVYATLKVREFFL